MRNALSCPDIELLHQFMLGQVSEPDAQSLEEHVAECIPCNARIEQFQTDDGLIAAMRQRSPILTSLESPELNNLIERMRGLHAAVRPTPPGENQGAPATGSFTTPQFHTSKQAVDFLDPTQSADELGRLGSYRILKVLGSGGMGLVFQAEDLRLRRLVALKVILDARYVDPRYLARFEREGDSLARLQHPNIVQIYEVGRHRGRPYFALEYVEGGSLAAQLVGQFQPIRASAELVQTLARAVHYAHQQGVVHRDLKPANILVSGGVVSGGVVKNGAAAPEHPSPLTDHNPTPTTHHSPLTIHHSPVQDHRLRSGQAPGRRWADSER